MLSGFTLKKMNENSNEVNEIIEYYENNVYFGTLTTDDISKIIDNAYINGYVITTSDARSIKQLIELLNKDGYDIKDEDELFANYNVDIIDGYDAYAIMWD